MKKFNSTKLLFGFLGIATFASLVGTVSGTLAWYAYNSKVTLSYSGTSIENSMQLQIGLVSPIAMPHDNTDPDNVDFWALMGEEEEFSTENAHYYFAPLGAGLSSPVINAYLKVNGYATTALRPLTTGYYDPEDNDCSFSLKRSPTSSHYMHDVPASKDDYITLPLVFRACKSKTEESDFAANQELWLTDAKAVASSSNDGNVNEAMRVYFDRDDNNYDTDYIVNPNAKDDLAGETKVGGLLDLTDDAYFDYDSYGEVIYGEWESPVDPTSERSNVGYVVPQGGAPVYDINNGNTVKTMDDANTFIARHRKGVKYYENLDGITFKTAKYESLGSIKPVRDAYTGALSNADNDKPTSLVITGGEEDNYIGYLDATIWLEGWDFALVDEENFHAFDFGLTFEINKIGFIE